MHTLALEVQAAWKVLAVGLVLGAGLPTLFAAGVRSMAGGEQEHAAAGAVAARHPIGRALAAVCFAIVLALVVLGIVYIVATGFGKALSFEHVYPVIQSKK